MFESLDEDKKAMDEYYEEIERQKTEQRAKDVTIIRTIKKQVPKQQFKQISLELYESENWSKLRIVDKPSGRQQNSGRSKIWVDQHVGACGDDFYGSCYFLLPDGKYLAWDYWM